MPDSAFQKLFSSRRGSLRCHDHDYYGPCIYMVTVMKEESTPRFCEIVDSGERDSAGRPVPWVRLEKGGEIINSQLERFCRENPNVRVLCRAVMPDHFHVEVYVMARSSRSLGEMVASFKGDCTLEGRLRGIVGDEGSFFAKGFNDLICRCPGQKDAMYRYVAENPYRYLVRRMFPEYFRRWVRLSTPHGEWMVYGNLALLDHPLKSVVRYSRRHTPEERCALEREWAEVMRQEGVLVSPFIHQLEREVYEGALDYGVSVIRVLTYVVSEREKPSGREFGLAEEGRLLLVAPVAGSLDSRHVTRERAMAANAAAEVIAGLAPGGYSLKRR